MTVYNLGSINADLFYQLDHLPMAGETLAAKSFTRGLGGKGANQSVAAALAGSEIVHIGAVGSDGQWAIDRMAGFGVRTDVISIIGDETGHAVINVDAEGENTIIISAGANGLQDSALISKALSGAVAGDILLLQNETNRQAEAAKMASELGLKVIYSAAPFSVESVRAVIPYVSLLVMNEVESQQLSAALETELTDVPVPAILVTKGGDGAEHMDLNSDTTIKVLAPKVEVADTTGAGDTFAGYFAAGLDQGLDIADAMTLATRASALKVTRHGTADAIPSRAEVDAFEV